MKKRILSLFLSVVMFATAIPLSVFAADGDSTSNSTSTLGVDDDVLANAIFLPITVRDFQSDGVLFEYSNTNSAAGGAYFLSTNGNPSVAPTATNQLDKGSNSATGGYGQSYVSRLLNTYTVANANTTYNSDGSVTFKATANDTQLDFTFDPFVYCNNYYSASSYRFLAIVYKGASGTITTSGAYQYYLQTTGSTANYGNTLTEAGVTDARVTYESSCGVLSTDDSEWHVAYIDLRPHFNAVLTKQAGANSYITIDKFRFDWSQAKDDQITVKGFYFVNPPNESQLSTTNTTTDTKGVDTAKPQNYFGVDSNGVLYASVKANTAGTSFGFRFNTNVEDRDAQAANGYNGLANKAIAFRYKATKGFTVHVVRKAAHDNNNAYDYNTSKTLIADGKWHWFVVAINSSANDIKQNTNYLHVYFANSGIAVNDKVDIAEALLLTTDHASAELGKFRQHQRVNGNGTIQAFNASATENKDRYFPVATVGGVTDTIVGQTANQDVLARSFADSTIGTGTTNGYYVNYYAQKANAVVNLFDLVSGAGNTVGMAVAGEYHVRYIQIRYRASGFTAQGTATLPFHCITASGSNNGATLDAIKENISTSVKIDADGKWHTAVVDLGQGCNWYLMDLYTSLPNEGASLDVDYMALFTDNFTANGVNYSGILGAEYWDPTASDINKYTEGYNYTHVAYTLVQLTAGETAPTSSNRVGDYAFSMLAKGKGTNAAAIQTWLNNGTAVTSNNLTADQMKLPRLGTVVGSDNFATNYPNGGTFVAGSWRRGLVKNELDENGNIQYDPVAVQFVAGLLSLSLMIPFENEDGSRNISALSGEIIPTNYLANYDLTKTSGDTSFDLAQYLRYVIPKYSGEDTFKIGTATTPDFEAAYAETLAKAKSGLTLKNITTCMDAAYFLLHNMWSSYNGENGYGETSNQYYNIGLIPYKEGTTDAYIFSSSFKNIVYDTATDGGLGVIYNKDYDTEFWMRRPDQTHANAYAANRFLTDNLVSESFGDTTYSRYYLSTGNLANIDDVYIRYTTAANDPNKTPTFVKEDGTATDEEGAKFDGEFYKKGINYSSTVEGRGMFVYDTSKDLFFEFTGDDDVYMFINGKLAVDLGGAHTRAGYRIDLNTVASDLGMENGETYEFAFFQAERHGYGSNFQIITNIEMATPDIAVTKTAKQNDAQLAYGANVAKTAESPLVYKFTLENTQESDMKLVNICFDDPILGVEFTPWELVFNSHTTISNLTVKTYDKANDTWHTYTTSQSGDYQLTEAKLKEILTGKLFPSQVADVESDNCGMSYGDRIEIDGINHILTQEQIDAGAFLNSVKVTAFTRNTAGTFRSYVKSANFLVVTANHKIYLWLKHARTFKWSELFVDNPMLGTYSSTKYFTNNGVDATNGDKYEAKVVLDQNTVPNNATISVTPDDTGNDYTFTVTFNNTGVHEFFYTVNTLLTRADGKKETATYHYSVAVYVYNAKDKYVVIDYGLPIMFAPKNVADTVNYLAGDTCTLENNGNDTTYAILGYCDEDGTLLSSPKAAVKGSYGTYGKIAKVEINGVDHTNVFTYTPTKFLKGYDNRYIKIGVYEKGTADADRFGVTKGIEMWKRIRIKPASVMYYEEFIGGITPNSTKYSTMYSYYKDGTSQGTTKPTARYYQSPDQSLHYGYDAAYNGDVSTALDGKEAVYLSKWFQKLYTVEDTGTGGFDGKGNNYEFSNNSVLFMNVGPDSNGSNPYKTAFNNKYGTTSLAAVTIPFRGKGIEIISHTNLYTATIIADLYKGSTFVQRKTVITKYTNGQLNQVPVIDFRDLTYGDYTVYLYPVPASSQTASPLFYLDGVRIYEPYCDSSGALNTTGFLDNEEAPKFYKIRETIIDNKAVISTVSKIASNGNITVKTGTDSTLVESVGNGLNGLVSAPTFATSAGSVLSYKNVGPNNEVYLDAGNAITFLVKEDSTLNRTFQVEAKLLAEPESGSTVYLTYVKKKSSSAVTTPATSASKAATPIASYTAMYIPVAVANCPYVTINGAKHYIATISCTGGRISISNIKTNDMTLVDISTYLPQTAEANATVLNTIHENMSATTLYLAAYNEDLFVKTVTATPAAAAGGNIKLNVVASANSERVFVKDSNGEFIENTVVSTKTLGEYKIYTVTVKAPDTAGVYDYSVCVQDKDNRLSEEMRTASITVQ